MRFFNRANMFKQLTRERYMKRLIETRGEDFSVVEARINHVLRMERWKQWFRSYFPRLSLNVFINRIVKPESPVSDLAKKIGEREASIKLEPVNYYEPEEKIIVERPDGT